MTIRITRVRKLLDNLQNSTEDLHEEIQKLKITSIIDDFTELREGLEETVDNLNEKDYLSEQQQERLDTYENLMTELDELEEDIEILNELEDKVKNLFDIFESMRQNT